MKSYNWMAWCKRDISDFFRGNFFSFKSAWIFVCAFQLSSTTFPCIFFAWFALCFWEKQRQNIEACTMKRTKQNKSISARKRYRRMFFYLIEKHMQKFRHFWRKKISPEKVTYIPLAPSHSIIHLISSLFKPWQTYYICSLKTTDDTCWTNLSVILKDMFHFCSKKGMCCYGNLTSHDI